MNAGIVFLNKKNPTGAWEQFDKAVKMKPEDPDGYFYRGSPRCKLKKKAEAKADLQKYVDLAPTGPRPPTRKIFKSIKEAGGASRLSSWRLGRREGSQPAAPSRQLPSNPRVRLLRRSLVLRSSG